MSRVAVLLALCTCVAGCSQVPSLSHPPVPLPLPEQVTPPPQSSSVLIWRPGYYDWTGSTYIWIPGQWTSRAGHGTLWQDGYWRRENGESVWVPAHWI